MPRILLLLLLIWVLYVVVKRFISNNTSKRGHQESTSKTEQIVACSQCGLHVPESESRMIDDLIVCNNPHCNKQS